MAITAATSLTSFTGFLTPEESAPIFEDSARQSAVQRLAPQVPLGATGKSIPVVTGRPVANWTAEGAKKPATAGAMDLVPMEPKKLAAIAVQSAEVVRANPGGYVTWLRSALAEAFAVAFDYAALYDLGGDGTGSGPFDNYIAATSKSVELGTTSTANGGLHGDIVAGLSLLVADGKRLSGFAFGDIMEPEFLSAVDTTGRPIYVETPLDDTTAAARPGRLIGRPSFMGEGIDNGTTRGFGGDFRKAAWGVVGGINFDVSDQATVTINGALVSLWEQNLVAVRAEAEYGFVIADEEHFVKYVDAV